MVNLKKNGKRLLVAALLALAGQWVYAQTVFVWPGDVNDNGVVNHIDLIYLGLHYGLQGPGRDSVSIDWQSHEVPKWLPAQPGRIDPAHADCNGDSTVDILDVMPIEVNHGLDNGFVTADSSSLSNLPTAAALSFDLPSDSIAAGSRDTIWIDYGSAAAPIDSLSGIAATISFDSNLVDSAYTWFGDSWLGTLGTDLITFERSRPGSISFSATRIDRGNATIGAGRIGGIVVVMDDNLKTHATAESMALEFSDVLCLNSEGEVILARTETRAVPVFTPMEELAALVFPVPAYDALHISLVNPVEGRTEGRLVNVQGQAVRSFEFGEWQYSLSVTDLQAGVYILELVRNNSTLRKRILVTND